VVRVVVIIIVGRVNIFRVRVRVRCSGAVRVKVGPWHTIDLRVRANSAGNVV